MALPTQIETQPPATDELAALAYKTVRVLDVIARNPWVDARGYGTAGTQGAISKAITAVGNKNRRLYITPDTWTLSSNVTIPSNVFTEIENGGTLAIPSGVTLTINGPFSAGLFQVFSCTGTGKVLFGPAACNEVVPEWWGAQGDGSTDDSVTLQAAIDTCYANYNTLGGPTTVRLQGKTYQCIGLVLKSEVQLVGNNLAMPDWTRYASHTVLRAAASGTVIDTLSDVDCDRAGIRGLTVYGLGAGSAATGLHFRRGSMLLVEKVSFPNFADQCVLIDQCSLPVMRDIYAQGLYNTTRTSKIGVLELGSTVYDGVFDHCEISGPTSTTAKSDANLYCCAIKNAGAGNQFVLSVAEFCDIGFHCTTASQSSRFVACRSEFNWGHGWELYAAAGLGHRVSDSTASNCGLDTDNTYDGFYVNMNNGQLSNCVARSETYAVHGLATARQHKYGFEDASQEANIPPQKNLYTNCRSVNHKTAWFIASGADYTQSSYPTQVQNGYVYYNAGTQLNADQRSGFVLNYGGPTTITDFLNGVDGQVITLKASNANVTIQNKVAGNIYTSTLADVNMLANKLYAFQYINGNWYQR